MLFYLILKSVWLAQLHAIYLFYLTRPKISSRCIQFCFINEFVYEIWIDNGEGALLKAGLMYGILQIGKRESKYWYLRGFTLNSHFKSRKMPKRQKHKKKTHQRNTLKKEKVGFVQNIARSRPCQSWLTVRVELRVRDSCAQLGNFVLQSCSKI